MNQIYSREELEFCIGYHCRIKEAVPKPNFDITYTHEYSVYREDLENYYGNPTWIIVEIPEFDKIRHKKLTRLLL